MKVYRRRAESDTWHFSRHCRWWPRRGFVQSVKKPTSGELCNECRAKRRERG